MVQIKKKQERGFWFTATLNSVPDVLIAAAAAAYFAIGIGGFFAIYFGFQVLYLALWLKRIAWGWFLYAVWSKRKMVDGLEEALYQKRFPRPPEYVTDIDEYMSQIADDNRAPPALRVKAAVELGTLAGVRMSGNALYAMQLGMAFEAALELYARRFPPRPELNTSRNIPMAMISLDDAYDQAAQSDFWAVRGKAIHAYAGLEQGLAQLFSAVSGVTPKVGGIIFFRISAAIRRTIIEELFRAKFKDECNLWRNSLFNFRRSTRSAIGSCTGTSSTMSAPTRIEPVPEI